MSNAVKANLEHIRTAASTFADRLRSEAVVAEPPAEGDGQRRLARWSRVIGGQDGEALAKRLQWDGLSPAQAAEALGPVHDRGAAEAAEPAWLRLIRAVWTPGGHTDPAVDRVLDPDRPRPFESLFLPLIRLARERLRTEVGATRYDRLTAPAQAAVERVLLDRLTRICGRALYAEWVAFRSCQPPFLGLSGAERARYDRFTGGLGRGGIWRFFQTYPVAARLSGTAAELWIRSNAEFLRRLDADEAAIRSALGLSGSLRVADVKADAGDSHGGGRCVYIVRLESGARIVYKPRGVELDHFFSEVLRWHNQSGGLLPMRPLEVLSRPGYGWIEYAPHVPCTTEEEVARFYTRCGILLALVHALNGSDFHMENMIASGEHPVLIDMEAVISHSFRLERLTDREPGAFKAAMALFERSVLRIGLLPFLKLEGGGHAADIAGIGGLVEADQPIETPVWRDINTDAMRIAKRKKTPRVVARNQAKLLEEETDPLDHVDRMRAGFRHTYRLMVDRRDEWLGADGLLERLRPCPVRFIFRNTSLYASLIEKTLHPNHLRDGADRAIQLDVLTKPLLALDERPQVWPLVHAEQESLENLDVPIFCAPADGTAVSLPDDSDLPGVFDRSAYQETWSRISSLGEDDLAIQERLIAAAFVTSRRRGLHRRAGLDDPASPPTALTPAQAVDAAAGIADRIMALTARDDEVGPIWFDARYIPSAGRYRLDLTGYNLFDGNPGPALLFAGLHRLRPGQGYRELALRTLQPVRAEIETLDRHLDRRQELSIGAGLGLGSTMYAFTLIAHLTGATELIDDARRIARLFDETLFDKDQRFDLLSGTPGAILALVTLYEATGDDSLLDRAETGLHRLLGRRSEPRDAPPADASSRDTGTGLAQGRAGTAMALLRLHAHRPRCAAHASAVTAIAEEQMRLGPALLRLDPDQDHRAAWSHGSAGIGLARLAGLTGYDTPAVRAEISAAIDRCSATIATGCDAACTGRMGRIELLVAAGTRLDRPELIRRARNAAGPRRRSGDDGTGYRTGWGAGYEDVGFHQGLAGIGYTLLRTARPDLLPSILAWEPPLDGGAITDPTGGQPCAI